MNGNKIGTAAGASLVLALVTLGCEGRDSSETATAGNTATGVASGDVGASAETTVRVADITGNPDRYMGQTVTVEADVEEVLAPYSFKLDEDAPLAGGVDNDLRVVYPKSLNLAAVDDQWLNNKVRVTGTVRRMSVVELEREVEWDLDQKLEVELQDKPVLIARSVQRIGGG